MGRERFIVGIRSRVEGGDKEGGLKPPLREEARKLKRRGHELSCPYIVELREEDLGFGFDYEEGVGRGVAGVAELLEGFVEGCGLDGEDYGAVVAADEVEAAFLLDELEVGGHFFGLRSLIRAKSRRPT